MRTSMGKLNRPSRIAVCSIRPAFSWQTKAVGDGTGVLEGVAEWVAVANAWGKDVEETLTDAGCDLLSVCVVGLEESVLNPRLLAIV